MRIELYIERIRMIFLFVISYRVDILFFRWRSFEINEGKIGIPRSEKRIKPRIEEFDSEVSIRPRFQREGLYICENTRVVGNSRHAKRDRVRTDEMSGSNRTKIYQR